MPKVDKKKKSKSQEKGASGGGQKRPKDRKKKTKHGSKGCKSRQKKGGHHGDKKRTRHGPKPPAPMTDENLDGIVLVKDRNKKEKQHLLKKMDSELGVPKTQLVKEVPWKVPTTPGPAERSLENVNASPMRSTEPHLPEILGPKKPSFDAKASTPMAGGDQMGQKKDSEPSFPKGKSNDQFKSKPEYPVQFAKTPQGRETFTFEADEPKKKERSEKNEDLTRKEESEKEKQLTKEEKTTKWRSYAEKMLEGGAEAVARDFRQIKGYLPTAATRVAFDAHPTENRFEDCVCIDHTRVVVKDRQDYLHASWVELDMTKKMILTQLPLVRTASKFWQMVLEQQTQAILVFLTHFEYEHFKADATFPEQQDFLHFEDRHIRVGEFKRVKVASNWTLRILSITNGDKKRYLHVHHYSGWTHGQELKNYMDLWKIQSVFRRYKETPVVVSLSGCGRAGTYAAFEMAHIRLHSDTGSEKLNVVDVIQQVRNGRMHAVQRASQVKTIHLALLDHVLNNGFLKDLPDKNKSNWEEMKKPVVDE